MRRLRHLDKDPSLESLPSRPINSARGSRSRRSSTATPPRGIRSLASRPSSALSPSSARTPKFTNHRSFSPSSADHRHRPTSRRRPRPSCATPQQQPPQHQQLSYYGLDERDLGPAIRLSLVGRGGTNRDVESLEGHLIHIKKELKQERKVVRELKTHVARLESDLARRDKAIEILLAKRYSTYQSPAVESIRVKHERNIVVCGLTRHIKQLRGIIQGQAVEMRAMAHSQKASMVMELTVEKEEYFYEVMRLREVVKAKDEQLKAGKNHIKLFSMQLRHRKISKEDAAILVEVNHDEEDDEEEEGLASIFATESPITQPIARSTPPRRSSYDQEGLPPCHSSINRQQSIPSKRRSTQQSSDSTTPPRRSSSPYDPEGLPPRRPSVSKPQSPPRRRSPIQRSSSTTAIATGPSPPSAAAAAGTPTVPGPTMRHQSRESLGAIERRQSSSASALGPPAPVPSLEAGNPLPQIEAQIEEEAKKSSTASRRGSQSKQQRRRSSVETLANRPPELKEEQIDQDEYGLDWSEVTPPQVAKEVIQSDPLPPMSPLDSEEDSESWSSKFEALIAEAPQEEEEKQQQQPQQHQQPHNAEMVSNEKDPVSRISSLEALVAEVPQEVAEQQQEKEEEEQQLQQQEAEISVSRNPEHQARIAEAPQEVDVQQQQRQEAEIGVSDGSHHQGMPLEELETGEEEEEEEEQQQQEAEIGVSEGSHHQGMPLEKLETDEEEEKRQQQEAEIVVPEEVHQELPLDTMKKREEEAEEQQEVVNALPDNHASIATAEEQPPTSSTEDFSTTVEAATKIQAVFRGNSVRSSPPPAGLFPLGNPPAPSSPHSDSSSPPVKQVESSLEEEEDKAKECIEEEANSAVTAEASSVPSDEPLPLSLLVRPPIDRSVSGLSALRSQPLKDLPPMPEAIPLPISKGWKSVTVELGRRESVGSGSSKSVEEVMSAPAVKVEEGGGEGLNLATELKELLKDEEGGGGGGGMGGEEGLTLANELKELLEHGDEDVGNGLYQIEGREQQGDGNDGGGPLGEVEGVVTAPAPVVAGLDLATELKELLEDDAVEDGLYQVEGEEQQEDGDDGEDLWEK